jgi:segregation and condensation protein A
LADYRVNLEIFAGPMDLLLYLVRKDEVDIYDIPIARITEQYIAYIDILKSMDIDIAGDFLVMAATLMEIKSAMLLPRENPEAADSEEAGDPRRELIRQLLEYKKFKDAANLLDASAQEASQRFARPSSIIDKLKPDAEPQIDLDQVSIWDLLEAFDSIMKATGRGAEYRHITDDTPIDLYQIEVLHRLQTEGAMSFKRIFEGRTNRLVLLGLFLGLLELIREKLAWAEQDEATGDIFVKPLTDEPAETAVRNAMLATAAEQRPMEQAELRTEEEAAQAGSEPAEPVEEESADDELDERFSVPEDLNTGENIEIPGEGGETGPIL